MVVAKSVQKHYAESIFDDQPIWSPRRQNVGGRKMSLVLANIDTFCKTIEKLIHQEHFVAIGQEGRPEGFGTKSRDEKT